MKQELLSKIENHTLTAGVVGLGYVGLPLAVEKAKAGFKTIGFDVQPEKVAMVNAGKNYIGDVTDADLSVLVERGMLRATSDFSFVKDVDFIAICVPTPLDKHQEPDISYVRDSAKAIAQHLRRGTMVVLESTTYPRHHGGVNPPDFGGRLRPEMRRGLLPRFQSGTRGPRQPHL